jgi:hypothetical protein
MMSKPVPAAPWEPTLDPVNSEPRHVVSDATVVVVLDGSVVVEVVDVVEAVVVVVVEGCWIK